MDRNARRVVGNQEFDGDWRLESLVTMGAYLSSREDRVVCKRTGGVQMISEDLRGFQVCQKRTNIYGVQPPERVKC